MKLASIFSPYMVFQQNEVFSVWGNSCNKTIKAKLVNLVSLVEISPLNINFDGGDFKISFPPLKGSFDSYSLRITSDNESIEISPIYCGDLFLFTGQSNMSISLSMMEDKEKSIRNIKDKELFVLNLIDEDVTKEGYINRPIKPKKDICEKCKWEKLRGDVLLKSSALVSMTLERLCPNLNYPLGAISASTGGISIDSFLDENTIENTPDIKSYLLSSGKYIEDKSRWNSFGPDNYTQQSGFYNEKIAPLKGLKFKSIIYYQGENSCFDFASGQYFKKALTSLIYSYRNYFEEDIPFVVLGIADEYYPYGDGCGLFYIQEAISSLSIKDVYYVPVFDIYPKWLVKDGNQVDHPIHTVSKGKVASRIAFILERNVYGSNGFNYPCVKDVKIERNSILLELDIKDDELELGKEYFGFTIANEDKVFYLAKAISIEPKKIRIYSPYVRKPIYFTYAFTHYSYLCDCRSIKGYPLSPCRNFYSEVDRKLFDLDYIISGLRFPSIMENNFGASVGGGFDVPTFEMGEYIRNQTGTINVQDGELRCLVSITNDSYFYSSIAFNLGLSGCFHRLAYYPYLAIDIKSNRNISFMGALFRINGNIYKFNSSSKEATSAYKTFYLDLNNVLDGSEGQVKIDKSLIESLSKIEFYFHADKAKKVNICIKNIRICKQNEKQREEENDKIIDSTLQLPGR